MLVILTDDNDLLIVDDFERVEYAVYPDVFRNVTVKDYTFQRTYQMDEVIYLTYNNEKLTKFMIPFKRPGKYVSLITTFNAAASSCNCSYIKPPLTAFLAWILDIL